MLRLGIENASKRGERGLAMAISAPHSPQQSSDHARTRLVRLPRLDVHMSTDFLDAGSEGSLSPDILQNKVFMHGYLHGQTTDLNFIFLVIIHIVLFFFLSE